MRLGKTPYIITMAQSHGTLDTHHPALTMAPGIAFPFIFDWSQPSVPDSVQWPRCPLTGRARGPESSGPPEGEEGQMLSLWAPFLTSNLSRKAVAVFSGYLQ